MIARNRGILMSLVAIVALAAVSVSASLSQEPEPSYSPDGAWLGKAHMLNGTTMPFMDIYTSNPTSQGRSGTVLCTLSSPAMQLPLPLGKVNVTPGAHGSWTRLGKNQFAFTAWRILIDADPARFPGAPMGMVKFWGTITPTGPDTFVGTMNAEYYGPTGTSFLTITGLTTEGTRIAVEIEDPE